MIDQEKISRAAEMILEAIGEDSSREGLRDTPRRVAKMYAEVFAGMDLDPTEHLKTYFCEKHEMIP